jgi:hypothetical protein
MWPYFIVPLEGHIRKVNIKGKINKIAIIRNFSNFSTVYSAK